MQILQVPHQYDMSPVCSDPGTPQGPPGPRQMLTMAMTMAIKGHGYGHSRDHAHGHGHPGQGRGHGHDHSLLSHLMAGEGTRK